MCEEVYVCRACNHVKKVVTGFEAKERCSCGAWEWQKAISCPNAMGHPGTPGPAGATAAAEPTVDQIVGERSEMDGATWDSCSAGLDIDP